MPDLIQNATTDAVISTQAFDATPTAGYYAGVTVDIYVNDVTPNKSSQIADFNLPGYAGYAAVTPTWSGAIRGDDGAIHQLSSLISFQQLGLVTACTVYGLFIKHGGTYVGAARFAEPIPMSDNLSVVAFLVDLLQGLPSIGSVDVVV